MTDQRHEDTGPEGPQVIDLEAEEIRPEADAPRPAAADEPDESTASPLPPHAPAPRRRRGGMAGWIIAALILGALAGGWLYRDVLSAYLPSDEMRSLRAQVAALETNVGSLSGELAAVKQAADAAAGSAASVGDAAAQAGEAARAASAQTADLAARLDQSEQRLAAVEQALESARTDLAAFRKSVSSPQPGTSGAAGPVDTAALAALGQRIDALEKDVASLKTAPGGTGEAQATSALSQALSDLKAKVAAGTPYAAEQDRISRMVPAAAGLDTLAAHAAEGLPDAAGLAAELRAAIPALPQPAAPPPEDDSYLGSLMKSLSGIVTIRPIGETDWPMVAERAAAFAEAGDLAQAISTIDGAEGEKPMALGQWRDRAAARLELEAAMAQVSEAVLRQIAAMGGAR
ncbi:COG4223 family protein [Aestuariivirga sp.]|uniref:COG4223 family protein n=1 Tax=Aestuariivirga sp. TaxID=2650926 RepID=UPI00391998D4